jgi:[protein-PII] uridylyltransferase
VVGVVAADRPGLFADVAGVLAAHGLGVRSALVRTVDGVAVDSWWVDAPRGVPEPAVLLTALRRLAAGDSTTLDRIARRDAAWRPHRHAAGLDPRVLLVPGGATGATVVEVRAADRPGLLHALGRALEDAGVDVRSAHVATYAGQAVDVLYLCEPAGGALAPSRVGAVVAALGDAADVR